MIHRTLTVALNKTDLDTKLKIVIDIDTKNNSLGKPSKNNKTKTKNN